jgi:hypothetical protein
MIDRRDHVRPDGRNCLIGTQKARQPTTVDVVTTDHGSLVTATPTSYRARKYFARHHAGATRIGGFDGAIAIEHRFAYDVLAAMLDAGMALQRSSDGAIARGKIRS